VVVDDGSTDSTAAILKTYDTRIRLITQRNRGLGAARNAGVVQSDSKYLAFLDADDLWLAGKLHTMVSALERNPAASLAFSEYSNFDADGANCGESSLRCAPSMEELLARRPIPILPSTWVLPRRTLERIGGFCEAFEGAGGFDDSWILLLLRELGEFEYVPERLTLYRVDACNPSADKYARGLSIFISLVKERYGPHGRALIRNAKNLQCRWLLTKIADQMNRRDTLGALRTLFRILGIRPAYFLGSEFIGRLCLPQNMRRVRDLLGV
jgi:glycosyltransferase involved in cell wall biosynthesis